ncbi:hypothetical protein [Chitinophaga nivalis]|uniref:Uncharacterized protein n=1 Tax=Chitinophaga nivalis TaxID=2991709 RepID=A0ABT3IFG2_9BACT|nr:hypothetical protein [Chitinophaga nivalis]MCW3467623.1 hypothetical protein [Chitinophaga nivalis]MCW3482685.1 hypothetical protein [Chitinophaga nivalis]
MTQLEYKRIKDALVQQRAKVTASSQEATKLIDDLGIRHIVIDATINSKKTTTTPKIASKKTATR